MTSDPVMPYVFTNGIRLAYDRWGRGERVLMIMGSGAGGRVWTLHQTPAITHAGYQAITFNHRGLTPSDAPVGKYALADMVADTKGLIEALGTGPCRIVGYSLGALIAQELAIHHPELVRCAVLIATKARSDATREQHTRAWQALAASGVALPRDFEAAVMAFEMLSPVTLNDDAAVSPWLDLFRHSQSDRVTAARQVWAESPDDQRAALRSVSAPCRVVAFSDDLIAPPHLGREVAAAIPDCDVVEIDKAGHFGHLERPDEVNAAILEFLKRTD
ncbi:alpha/beta fold hydrolase [Nonomuraea guangzhouensis]|uniref:Alpha/beta fold hydrolase n=1 Tax=Nonomuraea guangzhouensis TaxID=1291555 RepID=A0ABW4FZ50_9ACTN|nr:alpha/beta hydrolase [Nonomuraea guangzhouensis]